MNITPPTSPSWRPSNTVRDVIDMVDQALSERYGPFVLLYGLLWQSYLEHDYYCSHGRWITLRDRLREITSIENVALDRRINDYTLVLRAITWDDYTLIASSESLPEQPHTPVQESTTMGPKPRKSTMVPGPDGGIIDTTRAQPVSPGRFVSDRIREAEVHLDPASRSDSYSAVTVQVNELPARFSLGGREFVIVAGAQLLESLQRSRVKAATEERPQADTRHRGKLLRELTPQEAAEMGFYGDDKRELGAGD